METRDNIPWLARLILVTAIAIVAGPAFADEAIKLDPNLKTYAKVSCFESDSSRPLNLTNL